MRVYACVCCTSQTHRQGVACGRTACGEMIHGPPLTEQRAGQHWHLLTTFPCFGYCPKLRRVTRPRLRQRLGSLHGDRVVPCPVPGPSLTPCPWSRSDPCTLRFAPIASAAMHARRCRARPRREPLAHKRHYSYETNGAGASASVGTRVQLFGQISPKFQCFFRFR